MEGGIERVHESRGEGFAQASFTMIGQVLGSGMGASKKVSVTLESFKVKGVKPRISYLSLGVSTPQFLRPPIRWKIILDQSTVSRVLKPQFSAEMEESSYHRVIYDVSPITSSKSVNRGVHTLAILYDAAHPLTLNESCLFNVFDFQGSRYSVSYHTGAAILSPGDFPQCPDTPCSLY